MELQLTQNDFHGQRQGPVLVIVMDGVGLGPDYAGNAVTLARTPTLDNLYGSSLWTPLAAHGKSVGMPSDADMGNSEVGHNALGAGRVFDQGAKLVENAIACGSMFEDDAWNEVINNAIDKKSCVHFLGLFSDGNVHSHIEHLKSMIVQAHKRGVEKVAIHALLDGRDVGATSALEYTEPFEAWLAELNPNYGVASGGGRMVVTMDRYGAEWDMVKRGWHTHVLAEGPRFPSLSAAVKGLRAKDGSVSDQNLPPFVIERDGEAFAPIHDGDSVVFFNFRGDRSIEISQAFTGGEVPFDRVRQPDVVYAGMMQYDGDENIPARYLVAPPAIDRTLGSYLAANGVQQLACSETQKFGHVTYFWNGNKSGYFDQSVEQYDEVPSDVIPFEQRPWMKAAEITDQVIERLRANPQGFARLNFANGDMVGHTGVLESAILSVETVDMCLARLLPVLKELNGVAIITADHGNADEMYEFDKKTGAIKTDNGIAKPKTSHTLNKVPCILYDPQFNGEYTLNAGANVG
ncbi:MAG: 2,3-bisphosphoglycerate-independent phosphoglycerate mutase, partial [Planctomycetes bacterium]|nr:2,3-bisphosphoglycerate-independent phosphoglycerate mutase [Planctomycetota bacterium]